MPGVTDASPVGAGAVVVGSPVGDSSYESARLANAASGDSVTGKVVKPTRNSRRNGTTPSLVPERTHRASSSSTSPVGTRVEPVEEDLLRLGVAEGERHDAGRGEDALGGGDGDERRGAECAAVGDRGLLGRRMAALAAEDDAPEIDR